MPRTLVPLLFLFSLALPAAAAIVPGPEAEVTRPLVEPTAFDQSGGRIAGDSNGFLAVWNEQASAPPAIHAALLNSGGQRIGDEPIVIAARGLYPEVVWSGERYFVAWVDQSSLYGRFVEANGTLSEPFTIATNTGASTAVSLAANDSTIAAVWIDRERNAFYGAFITRTGEVRSLLNLGSTIGHVVEAVVTQVNGSFYFVTSRYNTEATPEGEGLYSDVGVKQIREDDPLGERMVLVPATGRVTNLMAASRTENALIGWSSPSNKSDDTIRSVAFTALGPGPISTVNVGESDQLQTVVADRSGYLLVYGDEDSHQAVRHGSTMPFTLAGPSPISFVLGGASGAETVLLVHDMSGVWGDLVTQRIDSEVFEPVMVAQRHQSSPDVAVAGGMKLAVWSDHNATIKRYEVVAARIGIDREPFRIAEGLSIARVFSNGRQWLVTWVSNSHLVGVRVSLDGKVLDGTPITIMPFVIYDDRFDVAWDGSAYVVAFITGFATRFGSDIIPGVVRVTEDGEVGTPVPLAQPADPHFGPAIAIGPEGALITWMTGVSRTLNSRLNGALVTTSGAIVPVSFPSPELPATTTTAVAWNGETFLVAAPFNPIHFFLVSANGNVTEAPAGVGVPVDRVKTRLELQPLGDRFLLTYGAYDAIHAATINGEGYIAEPPAAVAQLRGGFGTAGTTLVYARAIDALRNQLTRIFTRELVTVANPPKRRAVR